MNKLINFYPTLDVDTFEQTEPKVGYCFDYVDNGEMINVDFKIENDKFITLNDKSEWDTDTYDLNVNVNVKLSTPNKFYGPEGIAPANSKLALAYEWYSQKSKIRKVLLSEKTINNSENEYNDSFFFTIPKCTIEGEVNLSILIYLKEKSSKLEEDEFFLNNQEGVVLGSIDRKTLYLNGVGSLFPIFTKPSKDNKLWDIIINYEDPYIDKLSDSVQIVLNSAHKDYHLLDPSDKNYCERLIYEIVSNSVVMLFSTLKLKGDLDDLSQPSADGSIMNFIQYCKNTIGIEFDDALKMSSSLREYLDKGV